MWLANMSFCVNWGHFPGSIVSAQGNTLPSMEDLGATTGSCLKTIDIMSQVILEGSSTGIFIMGFHGYTSPYYSVDCPFRYQSEIIFTIAQKDYGTRLRMKMGVSSEHVSQVMQRTSMDIISLSFETSSQFLQLYLPKESTVARTRNTWLSNMTIIIQYQS